MLNIIYPHYDGWEQQCIWGMLPLLLILTHLHSRLFTHLSYHCQGDIVELQPVEE